MSEVHIKLSMIWVVVMLIYLLGDVLRIFSGDYLTADMNIAEASQGVLLGIAVLMLIPILMVFFSLALDQPVNRWLNILVAAFFLLFNLFGLPTYTGWYDQFLLAVSLVFNGITIYYAWNWVLPA